MCGNTQYIVKFRSSREANMNRLAVPSALERPCSKDALEAVAWSAPALVVLELVLASATSSSTSTSQLYYW
jgi:hypothetical protein